MIFTIVAATLTPGRWNWGLDGAIQGVMVIAAATMIHFAARTREGPGALQISAGGQTLSIKLDELLFEDVTGTVVNGKGEEKPISGKGISVRAILDLAKMQFSQGVTVYAADEFPAWLSFGEVDEDDRAWLLLEEDGSMRLIVFGDTDSICLFSCPTIFSSIKT